MYAKAALRHGSSRKLMTLSLNFVIMDSEGNEKIHE